MPFAQPGEERHSGSDAESLMRPIVGKKERQ
jgi:hypothetical protein